MGKGSWYGCNCIYGHFKAEDAATKNAIRLMDAEGLQAMPEHNLFQRVDDVNIRRERSLTSQRLVIDPSITSIDRTKTLPRALVSPATATHEDEPLNQMGPLIITEDNDVKYIVTEDLYLNYQKHICTT